MGLFEFNMPSLYGEGAKAFRRLQEEIIMSTPDATIFAWKTQTPHYLGILAPSLTAFAGMTPDDTDLRTTSEARPYAISNYGLQVELEFFGDENAPIVALDEYRQLRLRSEKVNRSYILSNTDCFGDDIDSDEEHILKHPAKKEVFHITLGSLSNQSMDTIRITKERKLLGKSTNPPRIVVSEF